MAETIAANASVPVVETRFVDMGVGSKIVFIGKLIVFFCTFGFAFPTLLND